MAALNAVAGEVTLLADSQEDQLGALLVEVRGLNQRLEQISAALQTSKC